MSLKHCLFFKFKNLLLNTSMVGVFALTTGCFDGSSSDSVNTNLSAEPASLNVSPAQTVSLILHNTSQSQVDNLVISPPVNLTGLSLQGYCSSIPANGQCVLSVTANSNIAAGFDTIKVSGKNVNSLSIPVQVGAVTQAALTTNKSMIALYQNTDTTDSLTVKNIGNAELTGVSLHNVPTGVSTQGGCQELATGQQCTFSLAATDQSSIGKHSDTTLNASGVTPIPLTIQVLPERQSSTATTLSATPNILVIEKGEEKTIALTNTGNYPIDGNLIINSNPFAEGDVTILPDRNCTHLAAHQSCNVTLHAAANSANYTAAPLTFSAHNVSRLESVSVSVNTNSTDLYFIHPLPAFSIEQGGTLKFTVGNIGTNPGNAHLAGVPPGLTWTINCSHQAVHGSCTFILDADETAALGPVDLTIIKDSSSLAFTLTVTSVTLDTQDLGNSIFVPTTGNSNSITITNTSNDTTADHIIVSGLPSGITANTCSSISPKRNCAITFTAANVSVSHAPISFTIQGNNTNALTGQALIEQPSLSLSPNPIHFNGPGTNVVTVTNNSHFQINNISPALSGTHGIAISNNRCDQLAPQAINGSASTCTFELEASTDAFVNPHNNTVSVSGTLNESSTVQGTDSINADPVVKINQDNKLILADDAGSVLSIPVSAQAGGFNLYDPELNLDLGENNANVSYNFSCPHPLIAGTSCNFVITNHTDLNPAHEGSLKISGSNLSEPVVQPITMIGGLAMRYIPLDSSYASNYYTNLINGPNYAVILLQNLGQSDTGSTFTLSSLNLTGNDLSIAPRSTSATDPVYGSHLKCAPSTANSYSTNRLAPGESCIIVLKGSGQHFVGFRSGSLTINANSNPNIGTLSKTFSLTNNGYLYAASNNVLQWDGSTWNTLAAEPTGNVYTLTTDPKGNLFISYAGGNLLSPTTKIAKWNGSDWSNLGTTGTASVNALISDSNGTIYAGGSFTSIGGVPANRIAKWNGNTWMPLAAGITGTGAPVVYTLAFDNQNNLYAGGQFTAFNNIAKWNGSSWETLGIGTNSTVSALATDAQGLVYVGGNFTKLGNLTANHIARWNGSNWSALGSGTNNSIYALASDSQGNLYAGGNFTSAGTSTASNIAKWNGNNWSALGSGPGNSQLALALATPANNLYTASAQVNKWNGNTWSTLPAPNGGRTNLNISALVFGNSLTVNNNP